MDAQSMTQPGSKAISLIVPAMPVNRIMQTRSHKPVTDLYLFIYLCAVPPGISAGICIVPVHSARTVIHAAVKSWLQPLMPCPCQAHLTQMPPLPRSPTIASHVQPQRLLQRIASCSAPPAVWLEIDLDT